MNRRLLADYLGSSWALIFYIDDDDVYDDED